MTPLPMLSSLLLVGCAAQPHAPQPGAPLVRASDLQTVLLDAHNRERTSFRLAPLSWDTALSVEAGLYARQLAAAGALRHSPRAARPGQGENLWMGTRGAFPPQQMVGSWIAERAAFRPGIFPAVSRTGNWADVGHYSQMIWPTTTRFGCGIASSRSADVLVCRYSPAGNIDGRRVP